MLAAVLAAILILSFQITWSPTQPTMLSNCANSDVGCGFVNHTLWFKLDDAESYIKTIDGISMRITQVPLYKQCTLCGYSFYIGHVTVSKQFLPGR